MASHVSASAFGHCLALVRDEEAAAALAAQAARRGGRSLGAVLGHARHQSLQYLAQHEPAPAVLGPEAGLADVAWALAWARPPGEQAIVDAASRYGLSRAGLGMALRLAPGAAAAQVDATNRAWDAELDPALLAWMGPGDCEELAQLLDGRPARTPDDLLALGADVAGHLPSCPPCADRRRAMASVRLLLAGTPLPAPPPSVVAAARRGQLQPPSPPPPMAPRPRRAGPKVAAALAGVAALGAVGAIVLSGDGGGEDSVQALARVADATGALQLDPAQLQLPVREVSLANRSGTDVGWEAGTDVPWLDVTPAQGRLAPGRSQVLRLDGEAPEGEVRASVRVSGDDGSAAAVSVGGTVERPPDLGASADGCTVTAVVEDESDVVLLLHWRGPGGEQTSSMVAADNGHIAELPEGTPLTWWVSARDGRDNQARTTDVVVAEGC